MQLGWSSFNGRRITESPDLFTAAVDGVPLSGTLRFEDGAAGPPNVTEFSFAKDPEGFETLYGTAAYEHVVPGTKYPATPVTADANDPGSITGRLPRRQRACKRRIPGSTRSSFALTTTLATGSPIPSLNRSTTGRTSLPFSLDFGDSKFQPTVLKPSVAASK